MIEESATVVDADPQSAWLQAESASGCASCSAAKGCGTSVLSKVLGRRALRFQVHNALGLRVGEQVVVGIEESAVLQASLLMYGAPLLGLLLGAGLGELLGARLGLHSPELLSISLGAVGLAAALHWVRTRTLGGAGASHFRPTVLRRLPP